MEGILEAEEMTIGQLLVRSRIRKTTAAHNRMNNVVLQRFNVKDQETYLKHLAQSWADAMNKPTSATTTENDN